MNTFQFLISGWSWNVTAITFGVLSVTGYLVLFRDRSRIGWLAAAFGVLLVTVMSPINTLADGYLFSAHMLQHILLLLVVPALVLLSLPRSVSLAVRPRILAHPFTGWIAGVGAMWFWHVPAMCNAAVSSAPMHALQTGSLLVLGGLFWRQILAPRDEERLAPPGAVIYLFSACVTCSVLGIIITFSPVAVCSIYSMPPTDHLELLQTIRSDWGITPERDQQIGGLLMWVPMCLIYFKCHLRANCALVRRVKNRGFHNDMIDDKTTKAPPGWEPLPAETLPRPTYFPAGLAMGTTLIFWGLITSIVVLLIGVALFAAALAGWITEIRHERKQRQP